MFPSVFKGSNQLASDLLQPEDVCYDANLKMIIIADTGWMIFSENIPDLPNTYLYLPIYVV